MTQISKRLSLTPKLAAGRCGPIDDLLEPEFFKGLCDPTRLKLLGCIAKCGRGCSVSEVAECCSVDFSVVSRHLALLERSGIVESAKEGRVVRYTVKYRHLVQRLRSLADAVESYDPKSRRRGKMEVCCG